MEIIGPKKKERPGVIRARDGKVIPLKTKEFGTIMEKLGTDTIMAIRTLKSLGGVNFDQLQEKNTGPRKCCCWGTPIGDKLLMLADDLDKDGNTLLA